jgi:cytochrome c oxidase assembly protein subunit 15
MNQIYIENNSQDNKLIKIWLFISVLFVLLMVFVGGYTRLTRSGLSITEWNFISGIIPPLSKSEWIKSFEKYKKIPEFNFVNPSMNLEEFKKIYLTEYFHRILGRITGFVILIPLILFFIFRKISFIFFLRNSFIFFLIIIQGTVGWFMVKSGLSDRTSVNEFMLGFHLVFALIIFSLL